MTVPGGTNCIGSTLAEPAAGGETARERFEHGRLDRAHARALLCSLLHTLLIFLLSLHQQRTFGRIMTAWLFNVHVFAGLQGGNCKCRVPVVGSGNGNGIHFLLRKHVAKVFFAYGRITQFMLSGCGELLKVIAVHIANMR